MIENSVNFIFLLTLLILVVIISKFCKDRGEWSCVFLLQGDKGAWAVLLEVSLAPASHGAGFSCLGPSLPGNVLVLVVNYVSIRGWMCTCSQTPQPEVTSRCCSAVGDGLSLFHGRVDVQSPCSPWARC